MVHTLSVAATWPRSKTALEPPASVGLVDPAVIEDLVAGSRILADPGVLDGSGHVRMRHPGNPGRLLMSRQQVVTRPWELWKAKATGK